MTEFKRYQIVLRGQDEVIQDTKLKRNLFFIAESSFGIRLEIRKLAEKVCEFLNREEI